MQTAMPVSIMILIEYVFLKMKRTEKLKTTSGVQNEETALPKNRLQVS